MHLLERLGIGALLVLSACASQATPTKVRDSREAKPPQVAHLRPQTERVNRVASSQPADSAATIERQSPKVPSITDVLAWAAPVGNFTLADTAEARTSTETRADADPVVESGKARTSARLETDRPSNDGTPKRQSLETRDIGELGPQPEAVESQKFPDEVVGFSFGMTLGNAASVCPGGLYSVSGNFASCAHCPRAVDFIGIDGPKGESLEPAILKFAGGRLVAVNVPVRGWMFALRRLGEKYGQPRLIRASQRWIAIGAGKIPMNSELAWPLEGGNIFLMNRKPGPTVHFVSELEESLDKSDY